jgi:uncharacterized RDD family membrane protein YckC
MSATVLVISITLFVGFLLNSTVLFLVLSRVRQKKHHDLFAGFLFALRVGPQYVPSYSEEEVRQVIVWSTRL